MKRREKGRGIHSAASRSQSGSRWKIKPSPDPRIIDWKARQGKARTWGAGDPLRNKFRAPPVKGRGIHSAASRSQSRSRWKIKPSPDPRIIDWKARQGKARARGAGDPLRNKFRAPPVKERGIHSAASRSQSRCRWKIKPSPDPRIIDWKARQGKGRTWGAGGLLRNKFRAPRAARLPPTAAAR